MVQPTAVYHGLLGHQAGKSGSWVIVNEEIREKF
jgi:hypothetical protein